MKMTELFKQCLYNDCLFELGQSIVKDYPATSDYMRRLPGSKYIFNQYTFTPNFVQCMQKLLSQNDAPQAPCEASIKSFRELDCVQKRLPKNQDLEKQNLITILSKSEKSLTIDPSQVEDSLFQITKYVSSIIEKYDRTLCDWLTTIKFAQFEIFQGQVFEFTLRVAIDATNFFFFAFILDNLECKITSLVVTK